METENRPNAALINREWYESAKNVLGAKDLSCVLVAAVEYVLYGDTAITLNDMARVVFAMVRPALDSDISKYRERCARNAANARSQRQRVVASGSQSQPVGANTTTTPTTTPTTTSTPCLSIDDTKQIERDKFQVWGYMWSSGSNAVQQECTAFWSYYESLGWRNNKGAAIVSRLACARMWRKQFDTKEPPAGAVQWFQAFKDCPIIDYAIFNAYAGAMISTEEEGVLEVRFRANEPYLADIEAKVPQCLEAFRRLCRADKVRLLPA